MADVGNHMLRRLPAPDRERLLAQCERVPLLLSAVLWLPNAP